MAAWLLLVSLLLLPACGGVGSSSSPNQPLPTPSADVGTPGPSADPIPTPTPLVLPAGSLDPTFGSGGIVLVATPPGFSIADFAIDDRDGLAILGGTYVLQREFERQLAVLRLLADGSPDAAFGADGFVETAAAPLLGPCAERSCYDSPSSIVVLPDDRVLVSAVVNSSALEPEPRRGVLLLYRTDGGLDPGFGDGGIEVPSAARSAVRLNDLQFDRAGRVVGVGSLGGPFAESRFLVARLRGDLAPDTTFGVEGFASAAARNDLAPGLVTAATRADGSVVAGGGSGTFGYRRPEIASFSAEGQLDPVFGRDGFVAEYPPDLGLAAGADELVVDDTGRITAAMDQRLVRYTPAGALDRAFGADGVLPFDFLLGELIASADGGVLAVGSNPNGGGGVLVRWNADGSPDEGFGDGGTAVLETVGGRPATFVSGVLDTQGRLVVLGEILGRPAIELFVARYIVADTVHAP